MAVQEVDVAGDSSAQTQSEMAEAASILLLRVNKSQ